jgi:hypothetical protein
VESIRATLGHQGHLGSRALALVGAVICGGYPEFLNGILGHRQDRGERIAVGLIVDVDAIERDVGHPSLQTQQIGNVSALQRDLAHLSFVKGVTDRSVYHVQGWSLRCHGYDFRRRANL